VEVQVVQEDEGIQCLKAKLQHILVVVLLLLFFLRVQAQQVTLLHMRFIFDFKLLSELVELDILCSPVGLCQELN
jgi:hypothetical protein